MISFSSRARPPQNVLVRLVERESILLNLETERYFGLDQAGTRMWQVVTSAPSIEIALLALQDELDLDFELLRTNLCDLISRLAENGLLVVDNPPLGT